MKAKKESDASKFNNSLVHLPLISSVALLIITLLMVAMFFSEVFHLIMIGAMAVSTGIMFYAWWQNRN